MNSLFTIGQVVETVAGTLSDETADRRVRPVVGVSTDSRTVKQDELFVALAGDRFDGHDFVPAALAAGAAGAIVAETWYREHAREISQQAPVIVVPDPLMALQTLAAAYRSRFALPVVGITGTNGKTTTKEMTAAILSKRFRTLKTPGNLNSQVGVPLVLFQLGPAYEVAVLELSMSQPDELTRLARMARPTVGVITNVGPAHLEFLGSVEAVARAKGELLDSLPDDGTAILNADDPLVMAQRHRTTARLLTFGLTPAAAVRAVDIEMELAGTTFRLTDGPAFRLNIPGCHHVANALAAIAVGRVFGVDVGAMQEALAGVQPFAMRMEYRVVDGLHLINDAYNANPVSARAALRTLANARTGRRIAVMGDMLELGAESEQAHREVGRAVAGAADVLITVGERARQIADGAREAGMDERAILVCQKNDDASVRIRACAKPGDIILIKGSRGMKMEDIVAALTAAGTG
ncbi:MAG: UDP-N-acetylmuramoyl-tripeptide--D-alanyl-D-alanine ligase [Candidatus Latescibacteria bacterium]|nr:UDP-N-acetylmuramoyl-tripeptide--D-alanyl-D-alanine ligase [Candidatus Latescibacterota bacterium]